MPSVPTRCCLPRSRPLVSCQPILTSPLTSVVLIQNSTFYDVLLFTVIREEHLMACPGHWRSMAVRTSHSSAVGLTRASTCDTPVLLAPSVKMAAVRLYSPVIPQLVFDGRRDCPGFQSLQLGDGREVGNQVECQVGFHIGIFLTVIYTHTLILFTHSRILSSLSQPHICKLNSQHSSPLQRLTRPAQDLQQRRKSNYKLELCSS